jgi:hypothetical protein
VTTDRQVEQLRLAHDEWHRNAVPDEQATLGGPDILDDKQARDVLARAKDLVRGHAAERTTRGYSAVIVTKGPHAGSDSSVTSLVARCLAFGVDVVAVHRLAAADADKVAHALYPDVWLNYSRMPVGEGMWQRIDARFDAETFAELHGCRYDRALVVTGLRACVDNGLTQEELIDIWQEGRLPLPRRVFAERYGTAFESRLFGDRDSYAWYRGEHPIGIHKVGSGVMAFALRHHKLYDNRPTILLNGHYALLAHRFQGPRGATVIELGLPADGIQRVRVRLVGAEDVPAACLPGTVRRDALDGRFDTDSPGTPVAAWANVVHCSDGYLAGAIESTALLGKRPHALEEHLLAEGYVRQEIDHLIASDPVVATGTDALRLTKRTAGLSAAGCVTTIRYFFPPLKEVGTGLHPLADLLAYPRDAAEQRRVNSPVTVEGGRVPTSPPADVVSLSPDLSRAGVELLARGAVGFLTPLAGSGGRFGGYDRPEGSAGRLKALIPSFQVQGTSVSPLDIRCAHVRFLAHVGNATPRLLISCSRLTESHVRGWADRNPNMPVRIARVPEMYRLRFDDGTDRDLPKMSLVDDILRDEDGRPMLKPTGTLGLLLAAVTSGELARWASDGVAVTVTANTDDVGFRVDRRVLGLFAEQPELDAVVLTTLLPHDDAPRGGLLRERPLDGRWVPYVEEHANRSRGPEYLNTNQLYIRTSSLLGAVGSAGPELDGFRTRLPLYYEVKEVRVGDARARALHAYQTYADVLRLFRHVLAVRISPQPRPGQPSGYAPLKTKDDVARGQRLLDLLGSDEGELSLP